MSNSKFAIWLEAARPRTLPLALASIVTGAAVAMWQDASMQGSQCWHC
ncbi:hypothetical protein PCI56_19405 [Plesiomonas shigelloides subsp. oncorhynchi]|nr:hypothetical protein [Plesiomonas shigelloides]